ncbi:MAG: hypothetical protein AAB425_07345 [Bdellovibrionota bacterium]
MKNHSPNRCVRNLVWQLIFWLTLIPCSERFAAAQTDRHVGVHPVIPRTGIAGGVVIAYGHVIPGPYQFRHSGSKLLVNGVQLIPSPVAEKEAEKIRASVKDDRRKLLKELEHVETRARVMFDGHRSHEEILQFIKSQTAVIGDAKWQGERTMILRLKGDKDFMHALWFKGLSQATRKQVEGAADPQEAQRRLVDQYERDLARGVCLFFSSDNGVMRMDDPRSKVIEVMKKTSLSGDERERAIFEIFPMNQIAAYDVLANYSEAEWVLKQK